MSAAPPEPSGDAPAPADEPVETRGVEDILVPTPADERGQRARRRRVERLGPHVLTRAARSLRDEPLLNVLAVAIVAAALVVAEVFVAAMLHVRHVSDGLVPGDEINVYVALDADREAIEALESAIRGLDGVAELRRISPEDAASMLAEDLPDWRDWLAELEPNPLPTTLVARLADPARDGDVARAVAELDSVEAVQSPGTYARGLARFADHVTRATAVLAGLVAATVLFIATAVMRLALGGRAREIEVMRFLGATEHAIRAPFLVEGLAMGALAGAIAAGVGVAANEGLGALTLPTLLSGMRGAALPWVPPAAIVAVALGGPALGLAGAALAARLGLRPAA